jgi:hypothetical protein
MTTLKSHPLFNSLLRTKATITIQWIAERLDAGS